MLARILFLLAMISSRVEALEKYRFTPTNPVGTTMSAISDNECCWAVVSAGAASGYVVLNATWGLNASQMIGALDTFSHLSNTRTAFTDGTITARIGTGTSQLFIGYRVAGGDWVLQAPLGGYIPSAGYCLRTVGSDWFVQYSNGSTLTSISSAAGVGAPDSDDIVNIYTVGTLHAIFLNGTRILSFSDSTRTSGGFSFGGYSTGTNYFRALTFDDGMNMAHRSPHWEDLLRPFLHKPEFQELW